MKHFVRFGGLAVCLLSVSGLPGRLAAAQALPSAPASSTQQGSPAAASTAQKSPAPAPLQLQSLAPETQADPFPVPNPKFFTATSPTVSEVDKFLTAIWGFDALRIWRVEAIQATGAAGVSKVVVFVSERRANAGVRTAIFFTTPDGAHAIADGTVIDFGPKPYAAVRAKLQARADGPARGAASKDLMLVEFTDLQCPHCKEAQKVMDQLAADFPKARIVYQSFPITEKHPYAQLAAQYGVCVAQKSSEAYFTYAQAVFDTQAGLTADDAVKTLNAAVGKAGLDPQEIATCAATDAAKAKVAASIKLGEEVGVTEVPMLSVNGHVLPLSTASYEALRSLIVFQAQQDGVPNVAPPLNLHPNE